MIRKDALATAVTDATERQALDTLSSKKDQAGATPDFAPPKGPGQDYSLDELVKLVGGKLEGRDYKDGERLFHSAACFSCHRFNGSGGGVGPDLTASASRYSFRDLLENIVEPSKVISDQYGSEEVQLADGTTLIGRTYVENDRIHVIFDPRNPDEKETAELSKVKSRKPSPISLMPAGLLNALNAEEVLNLLAYIQSAGDPKHAAFKK
jgi:putative heme-binding domain-containing protein